MLLESWPLIVSSVASLINMRMDQIMLGAMTNDSVVGNYSAAVRISEVWFIIPSILGASIYPAIIAAKQNSETIYRKRVRQISYYMALAILPTALVISLGSNLIANLLYGRQYASAGGYLAILIWSGVPYLVFFVFNQMYYIENLLRISFYVSISYGHVQYITEPHPDTCLRRNRCSNCHTRDRFGIERDIADDTQSKDGNLLGSVGYA